MLVGIILMQSSKSGGMGSAMTGNALNTAFGGQGADKLLVRVTTGLAVIFMILAIFIQRVQVAEVQPGNSGSSMEKNITKPENDSSDQDTNTSNETSAPN